MGISIVVIRGTYWTHLLYYVIALSLNIIMKNGKFAAMKFLRILLLALTINLITPSMGDAQCPMCRISAESNLKNGGKAGKGLNAGILFMLSLPYLMVGSIGYVWYKNRVKEPEEEGQ